MHIHTHIYIRQCAFRHTAACMSPGTHLPLPFPCNFTSLALPLQLATSLPLQLPFPCPSLATCNLHHLAICNCSLQLAMPLPLAACMLACRLECLLACILLFRDHTGSARLTHLVPNLIKIQTCIFDTLFCPKVPPKGHH